ncbi:hypothetical protein LRH25_02840 [Ideonella azotifigens]|uniref:Uncharacterized protein n=1 Tax=Ideonella azotifigens TaxID=513160 RepID=A0ABN1KK77_9BURK|nr:hypothetical protein [Ideonella azotifigens]MCD2339272.1 hypothetical protein [Ideonella azotifigens]
MNDNLLLQHLCSELAGPKEDELDPELHERLSVAEQVGRLHVHFHGSPMEATYFRLCRALREPGTAGRVASIVLNGPDEGANGVCNWRLDELLDGSTTFPELKLFSIAQSAPGDHNHRIVATGYEEDGALGRLLCKAPALEALIAPSAPNASFFEHAGHPLRRLDLDAGLATEDFIGNLADSKAFSGLKHLAFGEFNQTYLKDFRERRTPLEDYRRLFTSAAFSTVASFTWRNPPCAPGDVEALRALLPRRFTFKVIRYSSEYIRAA